MDQAAHTHSHDYPPLTQAQREAALGEAEMLARQKNVSLTRQRQTVFELLLDAGRPIGAYALMEKLSKKEQRGVAPPTIYRALDFLVELGVVSRLESSNEFIPCTHPTDPHDCIFLICTCCKKAVETDNKDVHAALGKVASASGFKTDRQVIELQGLCSDCQ
ncbi:MAG: Fur family transcriptional regulator [Pseudomonadota bacterium]